MAILKKHDLNPDGVRIVVNWDDMVVGSSVFILSINVQEALSQIRDVMNDRWSKFGDLSNGALRFLDEDTKRWLLEQANGNKVRLSVLVASIIKDAYAEERS